MPFEIKAAIPMADVPEPMVRTRSNKYLVLYEAIASLKRNTALPVTFDSLKAIESCRCSLRKIAQRQGEFLSSSRDRESFTAYFWLEPKDVADAIRSKSARKAAIL